MLQLTLSPSRAFALLLVLSLASVAFSQQDGNPHGWDRKRRCDQIDYSPPCGVCEGYGGIPYGDENDQIHLTTCEPIATASSVKNPVKPVWGATFTVHHYSEILIGPKTDPFCFNAFPSNSSIGKLCYRADSGMQSYQAKGGKGLRYDLNVKTVVGNVTTEVLHQGVNMWIINRLPWYAAGVHQCICTTVHQDSDLHSPTMYPVDYNWTEQMFYIGREKIGIEYGAPEDKEVLEHWAFGPHHVWSQPESGKIRRMWQPFNGLQVFPNGTGNHTVDPSLFMDAPPALCKKKGGATFRIKCDDNGYPINKPNESESGNSATSTAAPSEKDKKRAHQPKPRAHYRGDSFPQMSKTLNGWLKNGKHTRGRTRPCESFTTKELQELQGLLYLARDEKLNAIYEKAEDNRKLRASIEDLMDTWKKLNEDIDNHSESETLSQINRDGHCHEAVMWYVHHLTEDMKQILTETTDITIPLLSPSWHGHSCLEAKKLAEEGKETLDATFKKVCEHYQEQVTCASCHSNVSPPGHEFLSAMF
eukprot:g2055.t1